MTPSSRLAASRVLVWGAALAGTVHAGFSLYWALGGTWLLATVGQAAVRLSVNAPVQVGIALGLIAAAKLSAALIPVGVAYGRVPWPRFWRGVSWAGGLLLVAYGGIYTVVAIAVLTGMIRPTGGYDVVAMRGHAYLWDPLFFVWGSALVLSLWITSPRADEVARLPYAP